MLIDGAGQTEIVTDGGPPRYGFAPARSEDCDVRHEKVVQRGGEESIAHQAGSDEGGRIGFRERAIAGRGEPFAAITIDDLQPDGVEGAEPVAAPRGFVESGDGLKARVVRNLLEAAALAVGDAREQNA